MRNPDPDPGANDFICQNGMNCMENIYRNMHVHTKLDTVCISVYHEILYRERERRKKQQHFLFSSGASVTMRSKSSFQHAMLIQTAGRYRDKLTADESCWSKGMNDIIHSKSIDFIHISYLHFGDMFFSTYVYMICAIYFHI